MKNKIKKKVILKIELFENNIHKLKKNKNITIEIIKGKKFSCK